MILYFDIITKKLLKSKNVKHLSQYNRYLLRSLYLKHFNFKIPYFLMPRLYNQRIGHYRNLPSYIRHWLFSIKNPSPEIEDINEFRQLFYDRILYRLGFMFYKTKKNKKQKKKMHKIYLKRLNKRIKSRLHKMKRAEFVPKHIYQKDFPSILNTYRTFNIKITIQKTLCNFFISIYHRSRLIKYYSAGLAKQHGKKKKLAKHAMNLIAFYIAKRLKKLNRWGVRNHYKIRALIDLRIRPKDPIVQLLLKRISSPGWWKIKKRRKENEKKLKKQDDKILPLPIQYTYINVMFKNTFQAHNGCRVRKMRRK